jgi:uncharacterized protein YllA (UPF0747 family)
MTNKDSKQQNIPPVGMAWIVEEDGETDEQYKRRVEDTKQKLRKYYPHVEEMPEININAEYEKESKKEK